ncbi:hypothetical protein [Chryseobacterium sp. PET-29]|uniref:hypothetical protein n=1 Tax=Chryseobacterium sp. PET-29 TaxID=2983267 RepID=UPI0021E587D3|nr:hypothetical protein [Chryseobacterium sp. PET-29]
MKKIIILLLTSNFTILFSQITYLDEDDKIITEKEYNSRQISFGKLKVCNDSLQKCKIISTRSEEGTIDSDRIITDLEKLLKIQLDVDKPTIISFYPGADECNLTGSATARSKFLWHKELEKLADKIKSSNYLYIYKNKTNLKQFKKSQWFKDPKKYNREYFFPISLPMQQLCNYL